MLEIIGKYAFAQCLSLYSVYGNLIKNIGERAFFNDTNLNKINLCNVETFGSYSFYNSGLIKVINRKCKKLEVNVFNHAS